MINDDVSLPAVQRMLDHDSPEMTARYARIKDQTLRREGERYQQRINIVGSQTDAWKSYFNGGLFNFANAGTAAASSATRQPRLSGRAAPAS
jgi:hypothetical protein